MNTLLHKQRIKSIILFIFEILIVSGLFVAFDGFSPALAEKFL